MTHWIPFALVRIVVFFIGGTITALFYPDAISSGYAVVLLCGFVILYAALFILHRQIRKRKFNPGIVALPEGKNSLDEQQAKKILRRIPLGRFGKPSDVAQTILFLIQDATYITGQIIAVDGGRRL